MKNRIKTYSRVLLLPLLILAGCDSLLDVEPKQSVSGDQALQGAENVESVLIGAYDSFSDDDLMGGNTAVIAELFAHDENTPEINFSGTFQTLRQIFNKSVQNTNGQVQSTYNRGYITINLANIVLANLDQIEDQATKDRIQGEALFIRGTTFFELVKLFALPYSAGSTDTNPGIQLVTEPEEDYANIRMIDRSSVEATYDQIISDLTTARDLLPLSNGSLASTYAASAMLSRVYLQQADYQNAATEANRVIQSFEYSLVSDYEDVFNNSNNNTTEDIFAIQVSDQDGANDLNLYFASEENSGRGDINILDAHTNLYEAGDDRLDLFYFDVSGDNSTPRRTGKWMNQYGNINTIRLAEMYLTRAEANFELGVGNYVGPNTPREDVNEVRDRVNATPILEVNFDLDDILLERKLELAFEGQLLHDLKRRQMDVGTEAYNSTSIIFPIPQRETDINPNLN